MSARGVTLADVAAAAGVSVPTVSKALNGRGQLSTATRERVAAAARSLGFQPNQLARSLVSGRSFLVGVLSTDSYGRFTIPVLTGAEDTLGPGEIAMLLCESRGDPIREQHYIHALLGRRVDGIIVTGRSSDPRPSISAQVPVPVVYALSPSEDPSDMSVTPDDAGGAARGIEHLVGTGKRAIALVSGPRAHEASRHRVAGATRAAQATGAALAVEPMYGEWTERWGFEAATRLLDQIRAGAVNGILCASDQLARGVIDGLRENGVAIPESVGVVGVDNWDVMVNAARPSITSIDLNLRQVGRRAADRLLDAIATNEHTGGTELVDCFIVPREST